MLGPKIYNSVNVPIIGLLNWCNANERVNKNTPIVLKIVAKDAQGISGCGETYYSLKIEILD